MPRNGWLEAEAQVRLVDRHASEVGAPVARRLGVTRDGRQRGKRPEDEKGDRGDEELAGKRRGHPLPPGSAPWAALTIGDVRAPGSTPMVSDPTETLIGIDLSR